MENLLEDLFKAHKEMKLAKSNYDKGIIKDRIRSIEKLLGSNPIDSIRNSKAAKEVLAIDETQQESDKVLVLSTVTGKCIEKREEYDTARLKEISDSTITVKTTHSTYIMNSVNSVFYVIAHQIRVYGCSDIKIYAYTATGVFIEHSDNVEVLEYRPEHTPAYSNHTALYNFNEQNII